MDSLMNTFSYELEYGGPHVHFLAFLLFIFIGIAILHGVFRIVIEVLSRVTKVPRNSWRNTTIRTATGNMVIVPNKSIATATLTNYEQPLAECTISIPIGTLSSISCHWLPPLILEFKKKYPHVEFVLHQGDNNSIPEWVRTSEVDFGFVNMSVIFKKRRISCHRTSKPSTGTASSGNLGGFGC